MFFIKKYQVLCIGENWGDKGKFYIPYSYLLDTNLAGDFWIINFTVDSPPVSKKINKKIIKKLRKINKRNNYNK